MLVLDAMIVLLGISTSAATLPERVLHSFAGPDGAWPAAELIFDSAGNLYGTTSSGGGAETGGVVFELTPTPTGGWAGKAIYHFRGGSDGGGNISPLIMDSAGNLYGTAWSGGDLSFCGGYGCGVVFQLTPQPGGKWTESVLHAFTGPDGNEPLGGVVFDSAGNLYGTTVLGGDLSSCGGLGCGTVFKLTPTFGGWTQSLLYAFSGGADGSLPSSRLISDSAGNLYGTAYLGGTVNSNCPNGCGVVFALEPCCGGGWTETVLYTFDGGTGGYDPSARLLLDSGNLYGTARLGGTHGYGLVFKLTPTRVGEWKETVLYAFAGASDGRFPNSSLIFDPARDLYGTTLQGGSPSCPDGCGIVFKLTNIGGQWRETVLRSFTYSGLGGGTPAAGVILDSTGSIYGTTYFGGVGGAGVVFELLK